MAALKETVIRAITGENTKKHLSYLKKRERTKEKGLQVGRGRPKAEGRPLRVWEIVATTANEAQSGMFKQVGNIFVFDPAQAEQFLWQKVRLMHLEENWHIWFHPAWGIKAVFKIFGFAYPKPRRFQELPQAAREQAERRYIPAGLLDLTTPVTIPAVIDKITGEVREPARLVEERRYEKFLQDKWLPAFVYGNSKLTQNGQFTKKRYAGRLTSIFGINVDVTAKKENWFTIVVPEVNELIRRSMFLTEEGYTRLKDDMLHNAALVIQAGHDFIPNWIDIERNLRELVGPRAAEVTNRLRTEVEPLIKKMEEEGTGYTGNPVRRRLARSSTRPF